MVKGISRQVIVVQSPDPKLFEQAIFILKDEVVAQGVTDEMLLKEAQLAVRGVGQRKPSLFSCGPVWAVGGMAVTALAWALTGLL